MAIFDQRNTMLPVDPNASESPGVPGVDPVLGVGSVPFPGRKPSLRSILSRMQGVEFASVSPTLPYRPTVGSVFKDTLSGFFGGLSKGNEGKRELEESEAQRANREELTRLRRAETQAAIESSRANIEQEKARTALAEKSSNANALKLIFDIHKETSVPTDIIAPIVQQGLGGDIDAAGKALGVFSQASGLGDMGREYFNAMLGQMEDQRSPESVSDALQKSAAFVQKYKEKEFGNLLSQEELLKLQRKVAEKNLQKAEKEAELGASPEVIASMAGDLIQQAGQRENIAQDAAARIAAVAQPGAGDIASMLLSGDATQSQTALRAVSSLPEDSPIRTLTDIVLRNQAEADSLREAASAQYARIGQAIPARAEPKGKPPLAPFGELPSLSPQQDRGFGGSSILDEIGGAGRVMTKAFTGVDPKNVYTAVKEGKTEVIGSFVGTSRAQIAGDVQRAFDRAFQEGDEEALRRIASNMTIVDYTSGATDEKVSPQMRAAALTKLYTRYKQAGREDEFNEFILRRVLGEDKYSGLSELLGVISEKGDSPLSIIQKRARAAGGQGGPPDKAPFDMIEPGNIDMNTRPAVKNPDGTVSSVRSISIEQDGVEVLIPTVVGNRVVSDKEAIAEYLRTGKHLGKFKNAADATRYAKALHESEAAKLRARRGNP